MKTRVSRIFIMKHFQIAISKQPCLSFEKLQQLWYNYATPDETLFIAMDSEKSQRSGLW